MFDFRIKKHPKINIILRVFKIKVKKMNSLNHDIFELGVGNLNFPEILGIFFCRNYSLFLNCYFLWWCALMLNFLKILDSVEPFSFSVLSIFSSCFSAFSRALLKLLSRFTSNESTLWLIAADVCSNRQSYCRAKSLPSAYTKQYFITGVLFTQTNWNYLFGD